MGQKVFQMPELVAPYGSFQPSEPRKGGVQPAGRGLRRAASPWQRAA